MNHLMQQTAGVLLAAAATVAGAADKGPYEIKSGMFETRATAFGESITTEYFDDYGVKNAKYTTATVMGETSHRLEIHLPDGASYDIDLDHKTGTLMRVPPEMAKMMATALAPEMSKDAKVIKLAAKEVLGKSCDGKQIDAMGTRLRVWSWKGLPLYSEMGADPKPMIVQATKVSEGPVPADKFTVPPGIKIQNLSQ